MNIYDIIERKRKHPFLENPRSLERMKAEEIANLIDGLEKYYRRTLWDTQVICGMGDYTTEQKTEAKRKVMLAELNLKLAKMEARKNGYIC